jgi:hypothetical protein
VKVDQRGALGALPHPGHEFLGVRACIGGELVAGVPQVVEVDAFQTDSGQAGSQTRWRKLEWESGDPVELLKRTRPEMEPSANARTGRERRVTDDKYGAIWQRSRPR